ncbi:MAG: S66 peptidase family protein [Clostridiaceae bacterium]
MKKLLAKGDTIGFIACSNTLTIKNRVKIEELERTLNLMGVNVRYGNEIYRESGIHSDNPKIKAQGLMNLFNDESVKAIFDVSGGDLANSVLDFLDFSEIKNNPKPYFGYSDLSVIINPLHWMAGVDTYYYQIRNLAGRYKEKQIEDFHKSLFCGTGDLFDFKYNWIRGSRIEGEVVGGNLRCFLKLAGTKYIPSFENKVLFLESLGGDQGKIITYMTQYKHLGAFRNIKGIILGSFTEMEENNYKPKAEEILLSILDDNSIPVVKTDYLGHGQNSKAIRIGGNITLEKV